MRRSVRGSWLGLGNFNFTLKRISWQLLNPKKYIPFIELINYFVLVLSKDGVKLYCVVPWQPVLEHRYVITYNAGPEVNAGSALNASRSVKGVVTRLVTEQQDERLWGTNYHKQNRHAEPWK